MIHIAGSDDQDVTFVIRYDVSDGLAELRQSFKLSDPEGDWNEG
jgi:hypothetical protein